MIESPHEYEAAKLELSQLEEWLVRLHSEHPNPERGLTKVGIRKMIARVQEELGVYEAQLTVAAASSLGQTQCEITY